MGYRPQGPQAPQQGGYGQPELRPGVPVTSADGQWKGTVVEVLPAGRGYEGTVRVQWEGYGLTYVTLGMLGYDNGRFVVRSDGGQAQAAQGGQQQVQQGAEAAAEDRLAGARSANEADDLTVLPNAPRPQRPEPGAGYGQQSARGDDATRLASPNANDASPYARPNERAESGAQGQGMAQPMPRPSYPTPQQPAANMPYYAPHPNEQAEPDDITRLPQAGQQPMPGPVAQPAYPTPQQPAHPANPYYPEAPPLPETLQRQPGVGGGQPEVTVPIVEEQISAQPQWRDSGNVTVRTRTEEVPQSFTQQVEREEAFVERIPVGRVLADDEQVEPRQEGETFIMPVIVEEAVVITRRILAEEVRVTRRKVTNTQTVETTVRRQRAEIDSGALGDRVHDDRSGSGT